MSQVSLVPIMAWIVALACWGSAVWQGTRRGKRQGMQPVLWDFAVDRALRYLFIFPLGLVSLWAFVGHVFFPERAAAAIGWQGSPFQFEVGVANLGIGLAALYAAFAPFTARIAVAIVAACFLIGAGIGHVHGILTDGNVAPGNAGPILIADFLTPLSILVLLGCALWPRGRNRAIRFSWRRSSSRRGAPCGLIARRSTHSSRTRSVGQAQCLAKTSTLPSFFTSSTS